MPITLYTVGHSSRPLMDFAGLLKVNGIQVLVDVRRFPTSRAHPHFNRETLEPDLKAEGFRYVWLGNVLGGYRKGGYEAYMESAGFSAGLGELVELATASTTAAMCAEKHWSRCHRRFISDRLTAMGHRVIHILDKRTLEEHRLLPKQLELENLV